ESPRAAQLVKGYGEVRRRLTGVFDDLIQRAIQAGSLETLQSGRVAVATELTATYRRLVLQGPEQEPRAAALAAEVISRLEKNEPDAARAAITGSGAGGGTLRAVRRPGRAGSRKRKGGGPHRFVISGG